MSEVVLIYLHSPECVFVQQSTLYLGTYLQNNGFGVKIFNFVVGDNKKLKDEDWGALKKELKDCLCVGFSVMTSQVIKSLEASKLIKSVNPDVNIVWGGTHPTLFPEQVLNNDNIDFAISGEGEQPLLELAKALKSKQRNFSKIKGLAYKEEGRVIVNPPQEVFREFVNLVPDWDLISDFVKENMGTFFCGKHYRAIAVHTGRGCPYRCTFCINNIVFGKTRRIKPIDVIMEEIKLLSEKFQPNLFNIMDDNFFINKKDVEEFCERLEKEGFKIKWHGNARVNYFAAYDDKFMEMLRDSGCMAIGFGAESGSPRILQYLKKDITPTQIYDAGVKCVQYGIFPIFSFMIGLPNETKEDVLMTLDLISRLKKLSTNVGFTTLQILRPYPGGEIYQDCLKYGIYEPKTLEEWEHKSKVSQQYLDPKDLPWIKNPEDIGVIAKYASKGVNNYLVGMDINPVLKFSFGLRSNLFDKLSYSYVKADNKYLKKVIRLSLAVTDKISNMLKPMATKSIKEMRAYK